MSRFSEVSYDPGAQTVRIGAGLIWDDVYAALEPHGVNVVGGRVTGVGVAGLTLGGGMFKSCVRWADNPINSLNRLLVVIESVRSDY